MSKKKPEAKTARRTKLKNIPPSKAALTAEAARKIKGGHGYQILSAGRDAELKK